MHQVVEQASRLGTSGPLVTKLFAGGLDEVESSVAAMQRRIMSSILCMPAAVQPPIDRSLAGAEAFELDTVQSQLIPFEA